MQHNTVQCHGTGLTLSWGSHVLVIEVVVVMVVVVVVVFII